MLSAAALAGAMTPLILPDFARAAEWLGTFDNDYNAGSNWTGNAVPAGTATFGTGALVQNVTVTAAASLTLLEYTNNALAYTLTTGPDLAMSIVDITNSSSVAQRFTANNQSAFVIYGTVSGDVVFTAGASAGSIEFFGGSSANQSRFVGEGGYLSLRDFSGQTLNFGSIEGSGLIRSDNSGPTTLSVGGLNTDTTYSGAIIDDIALTKVGTGTLTLTNAGNTHTGGTTLVGGTISVAADGALGAASAGLTFRGGTLQSTASFATDRTVDLQVPSSGENRFLTSAGTTLTVNGVVSGSGGLVKDGAGTLVLNGNNTYGGGTVLRAGTISISSNANLGGASGLTFDGGTLQTTADITTARAMLVQSGGAIIDTAADTTLTASGVVSGAGRLTKDGAGTLTLTGANTYAGGTFISGGIFRVTGGGSITHSSDVTQMRGGRLEIVNGADMSSLYSFIANQLGDTAEAVVDGAGSTWVNRAGLNVGVGGAGNLTISGGAVVTNSTVFSNAGVIGVDAGSVGSVTVTGVGSVWGNSAGLIIGNDGSGELTVSAGGTVTAAGSTGVGSGDEATSNGRLTLTGMGSSLTTGGIYIGVQSGTVSVLAGATLESVTVPTTIFGSSTIEAGGTALVSGTGSRWDSDAWFYLDGALTVADGGVISVGATGLEEIVLSRSVAGGVLNIGAAVGNAAVAPGTLDVETVRSVLAGTLNFNHTGTSYSFSPTIGDALTVNAVAGTTILSGANTYTGGTVISGGTLQAGNNAALGTGSLNMTSSDARLIPAGYQIGIAGLDGVSGAEVNLGNSGTSVLTLTSANGSYNFAGNIVGGGVDPTNLAIVKDGASTQTLSGDNIFMGVLRVVGGTLVLASNTALSSNALLAVAAGAQVTVDNVDVTIAELYAAGVADGTVLLDGVGSSLTVALDGANNAFSGVLTGAGAFIVDGAGLIQTLTSVSDYTGGTSITKGTLRLTGDGALASTGAVELTSAAAVFDMSGVTGDRIIGDFSGVTGSSVNIGAHGLTVGTANDTDFDGVISGIGGTLAKAGSGRLTLGGANTFTGLTTISGGTLEVDGALAGALTAQNGTTLGGTGTVAGAVTIADGATLAPGASPGTLTVGSLLLSSGSILNFELGEAGVAGGALNDLVAVTTDLTLAGELNISESAGGSFGLGTYTLFTYGGTLTFPAPLTVGAAPIGYTVGNFTLDTATAGSVDLIVAATTTDQYWIGGTGTWNAGNLAWTDESGGISTAWGGQTGIFRGTAGTVTLDGAQSFNALRFESSGYVLEGDPLSIAGVQGDVRVDTGLTATINTVISGSGLLAKGGGGTLVLNGINTYSGGTLIAGGVLAIADDANLGDVAGGVALDGGTLQLIGSADIASNRAFTVGAAGGGIDTGAFDLDIIDISGPGTLVKTGTGALTINGTGSLSGGVALLEGGIDVHLGGGSTFTGDIDGVFGTEVGLIARGTNGAYAGVISGDTGLYVGGAGTITLSGTNTFSGYTVIDTGATLALTGAASIAASDHLDLYGTLDISGTSTGASIQSLGFDGTVLLGAQTLSLTNAGDLFSGTISGSGGVSLLAGVQGFAGTSTYRGATNVGADAFMIALTPNALSAASAFTVNGVLGLGADQTIGSLAGAGIVGLNDPSGTDSVELTVGGNGTTTVFSGALIGAGTLIKSGAGTFTLTGDLSAFDGGFAVNGGELAINTMFGGTLDVLSGGTLQGSGAVGSVAIAAGATVAPGNSIGTLTVTGDAVFSAGAIYRVEIDPTGASDLLAAGGVATLGGATVEVLKATGSYTAGTRYTILTAAGGVSGTFGTLTQSLPFLDLALAYDASEVYLDIARNAVTFPSVGTTANEQAVGGAVESLGAGNPVYESVVSLTSAEAARGAFNSLSGEIGASARGVLINDSQFVRNAVFERLVTAGSGAPSGLSVAPLGYAQPAKSGVPFPAKAAAASVAAPASAIWAQGFGSWGSTDGNGNAASLDRNTGGFFMGADTLVGDWRLGVLGGYSRTAFDVDARASSGASDNIHAGLYAGTNWGAINFRSGASYTWNDISTRRNVSIPTRQLLEADYDAGTAQVFGELGYGLVFGAVDVEPFAGFAYVNLHTDGFAETGGAAALASGLDSNDATYTTLGLRASTMFESGSFATTLRGMLGWRHAFGDITPTTTYQFAAGGSPFTVSGLPIAEDALVMDVGLDMALNEEASLGVFYSAQLGDSAQDQSVRGTLNWKF